MENIFFLQGKVIFIIEINLVCVNGTMDLLLKVKYSGESYRLIFRNVSRFSIDDLSAPMEVQGFEIVDHSSSGWDKDSRFEIRDFEENKINFYCEEYKLVND